MAFSNSFRTSPAVEGKALPAFGDRFWLRACEAASEYLLSQTVSLDLIRLMLNSWEPSDAAASFTAAAGLVGGVVEGLEYFFFLDIILPHCITIQTKR